MRTICILAVFAVPAFAESKEEYTLRKLMDALHGNWSVKSQTVAGQSTDPTAIKSVGYRFDGDSFSRTDKPEEAARMSIDVSGPIPTIDLVDRYAVRRIGIIQRVGDKVMICVVEEGEKPPTSFESTKKNNAVLIELAPMKR